MAEAKVLHAETRTGTGKNVNNRLRSSGFIPAVLYSHGTTESIKIEEKNFFKLFKGHISESVIFNLDIPGHKDASQLMAFVKDYQKDPVSGKVLHLDLFKVTKGEKIHTTVPVELIGAPVGVKAGGVLEVSEREIMIECLPMELPEKIVVDVTPLEIGTFIHAKDIPLTGSVKLLSNPEAVIAGVVTPKAVVEEKPEAAAAEAAPGAEQPADKGKEKEKGE